MITQAEVDRVNALFDTFKTVDDVVDYLRSQGIKGTRGCVTICPIAIALQRLLGRDDIAVILTKWGIDNSATIESINIVDSFDLPLSVTNFINRFDRWDYYDDLYGSLECPHIV